MRKTCIYEMSRSMLMLQITRIIGAGEGAGSRRESKSAGAAVPSAVHVAIVHATKVQKYISLCPISGIQVTMPLKSLNLPPMA